MSIYKEFQFPVSVRWHGGRLARADSRKKESLEVATPPEFRGGLEGHWSPEDLLVAATASCFVLTLVAVAERRQAPSWTSRSARPAIWADARTVVSASP
jgi:organic hydroperoxide reductase OsmC/OhrA